MESSILMSGGMNENNGIALILQFITLMMFKFTNKYLKLNFIFSFFTIMNISK